MATDFRLKDQLPKISDEIVKTYDEVSSINHLGHCPLPNYDEIITCIEDLRVLAQRGRVVSWSIALCTLTALLIAAVIALMFIGAFFAFDASVPVALLFIAAMLSMIAALALFLREVHLALSTLRFGGATFVELSRRDPD